jgi:lysophospholipase L1-like esterase
MNYAPAGVSGFSALAVAAILPIRAEFYLKDGDKLLFYGDSITDRRVYTAMTEAYILTRFPELRVTFINSAVSGDRVTGGAAGTIDVRLRHDILPYRPTVVTILLGMNDGGYTAHLMPNCFKPIRRGMKASSAPCGRRCRACA